MTKKKFIIDLVICIDSPDFNYQLAKKLKKNGFKSNIIQIVAPTVWAWRKKRAKKFAKFYNEIFTLFDFSMNLACRPGFGFSMLNSTTYGTPIRGKEYPDAYFKMSTGSQTTKIPAFRFIEYSNGWELGASLQPGIFRSFTSGSRLKFEIYMNNRFVVGHVVDLNKARRSIMRAKLLCEAKLK